MLRWADEKKASKWLANHASDVHAVGLSSRCIAKILKEIGTAYKTYEDLNKNNNPSDSEARLRVDEDYMSAVENGNMETAGSMVREAAKRAMPDTKVVDDDGDPIVVYRGGEKMNEFDPSVLTGR